MVKHIYPGIGDETLGYVNSDDIANLQIASPYSDLAVRSV